MGIDARKLSRIRIIHEDDTVLAVNKPAGLAVHGGAGTGGRSLIEILRAASDDTLTLIHRLDRATSGVMVIAKNAEDAARFASVWDAVEKRYLALAFGRLEAEQTIAAPLADGTGRVQSAVTQVAPVAWSSRVEPEVTLLAVTLHTGRKHQIRRHLAGIGHPLAGDDKHGDFSRNRAFAAVMKARDVAIRRTLFLHAARLALPAEAPGGARTFTAPPPDRWREVGRAVGVPVDESSFLS